MMNSIFLAPLLLILASQCSTEPLTGKRIIKCFIGMDYIGDDKLHRGQLHSGGLSHKDPTFVTEKENF